MKNLIVNNGWWEDLSADLIFDYIEEEIPNWHGLSLEDVRASLRLSPVDVVEKYGTETDKQIIKQCVEKEQCNAGTIEKVIKSLEYYLAERKEKLRRFRVAYSTQINIDDPFWAKKTDDKPQIELKMH